jgi:hypothetical protein
VSIPSVVRRLLGVCWNVSGTAICPHFRSIAELPHKIQLISKLLKISFCILLRQILLVCRLLLTSTILEWLEKEKLPCVLQLCSSESEYAICCPFLLCSYWSNFSFPLHIQEVEVLIYCCDCNENGIMQRFYDQRVSWHQHQPSGQHVTTNFSLVKLQTRYTILFNTPPQKKKVLFQRDNTTIHSRMKQHKRTYCLSIHNY